MSSSPRKFVQWLRATALLAAASAGMLAFRGRLDKAHVALVYVLVVLTGSALGGRTVGLALSGAAFLLFDSLFLPPYNTLTINDPLDWLVLVTFLVTGVVAAELIDRQRRQTRLAELRRVELNELAALGAETLNAPRAENALEAIASVIRSSVQVGRCQLFVRQADGQLLPIADTDQSQRATIEMAVPGPMQPMTGEAGLLQYIIDTGKAAILLPDGTVHVIRNSESPFETETSEIRNVRALAIPLAVRGSTVGALRVSSREQFSLTPEQNRKLGTLSYYAALGVERLRLEQTETSADELRAAGKMKDVLLAAVSHDLRTPLTTIKAIAHEISREGEDRAVVIEQEADRLAELVDGLLELSALNAGVSNPKLELNTIDELVGAALARSQSALAGHSVETDLEQWELLVGYFDFASSLRILTNVLENAAKYSPPRAPISVSARRNAGMLEISVADRGNGIELAERERIFEPFYRVPGATADLRGAGLGLSISKRLANAQGGDLIVSARDGYGSVFTLLLKAGDAPLA